MKLKQAEEQLTQAQSDLGRIRALVDASLTRLGLAERQWLMSPEGVEATRTYDAAVDAARGRRGADVIRKAALAAYEAARDAATKTPQDLDLEAQLTRAHADVIRASSLVTQIRTEANGVRVLAEATARVVLPDVVVHVRGTPGARREEEMSWDKYSKGWHRNHGPTKIVSIHVDVTPEWGDVSAAGLATVGGMLTLTATPVESPPGYAAWEASWVERGRGHNVRVVGGVIVAAPGRDTEYAHADDVAHGVSLLRRRAKAAAKTEAQRTGADLLGHLDVHVTLADSRAAGNCETGTRSWCARAGLDADAGATVREVLDALAAGAGDAQRAYAACRRAVRHARRASEVAA